MGSRHECPNQFSLASFQIVAPPVSRQKKKVVQMACRPKISARSHRPWRETFTSALLFAHPG